MTQLQSFSKYKAQLMGMAIFIVMLFHCCKASCFKLPVLNLARYGFTGVDIFFLLSGMGLCYAWHKKPAIAHFLKRRMTRIFPTLWIVLVLYHILAAVVHYVCARTGNAHIMEMAGQNFNYPHSVLQYISFYTGGWGFFFTRDRSYWFEWYVPTQLLFYLLFPLIIAFATNFRRAVVALIVAMLISVGLAYWYTISGDESLRFLSFSRLPIFVLGVVIYYAIQGDNRWLAPALLAISAVAMVECLALDLPDAETPFNTFFHLCCGYRFFIIPGLCLLLIPLFKLNIISTIFTFLGSISLELYLVHIKLVFLLRFALPRWDAFGVLILFVISIPAAWCLHWLAVKFGKILFKQ